MNIIQTDNVICYGYYIDNYFVYHNENGPAVIYPKSIEWWYHDKLHRLCGPAFEDIYGNKVYYVDNIVYSEKDYQEAVKKYKLHLLCK